MTNMLNETDKKVNILSSFAMIFSEITDEVAAEVVEFILTSNFSPKEDKPEVLNLIICSPGGSLHPTFAIIDVMASSRIPIRTIGLGQIASAGLMIFLAGEKGQRILTPNTSIMSHRWSSGSDSQKSHELWALQKEHNLTSNRMFAHYKKCTGLSDKIIRDKLLPPEDVYLSAQEALKLKICDSVATL